MIINYIILGIFFPWLLGYILLSMEEKFNLIKYFLAFPLGIGLISYQLFFYSLIGLKFNLILLFLPWIIVLSYIIFKKKKKFSLGFDIKEIKISRLDLIFIIVIFFGLIFVFGETLLKPNSDLDSLSIWSLKGKAFFIDKTISKKFFDQSREYSHFDYPLLVPLSQTWLALMLGRWSDTLVKIISPIFYLSLLGTFFCFLRQITEEKWALMCTAFLSSFPILIKFSQISTADIPLAYYLFITICLIYIIFFKEVKLHFIWPALFLSFLVWTKNEGLMLGLLIIFLSLIHLLRNRKFRSSLNLFAILGLLAGLNFPWWIYKQEMGFINDIVNINAVSSLSIGRIYLQIPIITKYFTNEIFLSGHWYGLWWMYLAMIFAFRKKIFSYPKEILLDFINLSLFVYGGVFLLIPGNVGMHLGLTIDRLVLHIVPIALLFIILCFKEREDLRQI